MFLFCLIERAFLQKYIDDMVVLYCKYVDEGGGGSGGPPPEFFGLKWCKIV